MGSLLGSAALSCRVLPASGGDPAGVVVRNADGTQPVRYPNLQAAADAIAPGQVCVITGAISQAATFNAHDITIMGSGKGNALAGTLTDNLHGAITADGKGMLVLNGANTTVRNLELFGAVPSLNANGDNATAAIRYLGRGITLQNCHIHDCNEGILGGNSNTGDCLIDSCHFFNCGDGTGQTHNIYIGRGTDNFTLQNSRSSGSNGGHLVKTRARQSTIRTTYLESLDAPSSGRCIDAANGGVVLVQHCVLEGGTGAGTNPDFIGVALEGPAPGNHSTTVEHCIVINDEGNVCGLFKTNSPQPCVCKDSTLVSNGARYPMNLKLGGSGAVSGSGGSVFDSRARAGYPAYNGKFNCLPALPQ